MSVRVFRISLADTCGLVDSQTSVLVEMPETTHQRLRFPIDVGAGMVTIGLGNGVSDVTASKTR